MRILFITHRLPYPPDKGERIRAFHELKYLAERHEVDLFCLADSTREIDKNVACLREFCHTTHVVPLGKFMRLCRALWSFVVRHPFSFGYFWSSKLRRAIRKSLNNRRHDIIFVNCSSMVQYVSPRAPAPLIVDFVDADSNKFRQYSERSSSLLLRLFYRAEAKRVAAMERSIGHLADLSLVITHNDATELGASTWTGSEIRVLGNGIEVPPEQEDSSGVMSLQPFVLFLGTMSYWPNVDAAAHFARDIYPEVRRLNPELKYLVVGRNPAKPVQDLARLPGVTVVGSVPNPFEYFRAAAVAVAPFRVSQGFHNKIAESLAVGTPVISSSRAASGIGLTEKEGLFTADNSIDFAYKVVEVAANRELRQALRRNVREVRDQLRWDSKLANLSLYIEEVVGRPAAAFQNKVLATNGVEQR